MGTRPRAGAGRVVRPVNRLDETFFNRAPGERDSLGSPAVIEIFYTAIGGHPLSV
ncbi:MAG: hypothetical protein ACRDYU_00145 [Actinomycetes bacterium]